MDVVPYPSLSLSIPTCMQCPWEVVAFAHPLTPCEAATAAHAARNDFGGCCRSPCATAAAVLYETPCAVLVATPVRLTSREDVELFRQMYAGTFLTVTNQFGLSAACFLFQGVLLGAPTSPNVFNVVFNPIYVLVQACKRGYAPLAGSEPMDTSGFCDDTTMHSDGPDTVPAMQVMVRAVAPFVEWLGLLLNMLKSKISAINHAIGLSGSDGQYHVQQHTIHCPSPGCSTQGSGSVYDLDRKLQVA
jgi:hypothetical protein